MKILVPVKRVADPDNADKVEVSADGGSIQSKGLEWRINPYDEYALEAALRLTEDGASKVRSGEVVLVSIGPAEVVSTLRQGLAMGADRAVIVAADDESLDADSVAQILAAVVRRESPDAVVMGKITVDSDSDATGQHLAEALGWPMATHAMRIRTEKDSEELEVERETDGGTVTVRLKTPAVITVSDRIIHPASVSNGITPADFRYPEAEGGRYASLKGIMAAKKKKADELTLEALAITPTPLIRYEKFEPAPKRTGAAVVVGSAEELVQRLRDEAKVL